MATLSRSSVCSDLPSLEGEMAAALRSYGAHRGWMERGVRWERCEAWGSWARAAVLGERLVVAGEVDDVRDGHGMVTAAPVSPKTNRGTVIWISTRGT